MPEIEIEIEHDDNPEELAGDPVPDPWDLPDPDDAEARP